MGIARSASGELSNAGGPSDRICTDSWTETVLSYCKVLRTDGLLSKSPSTKRNPLKPSGHYMYRQFNIQ